MTGGWAAAGVALFTWWFSTGIILLVVNRAERAGGAAPERATLLALPALALGAVGAHLSLSDASAAGAYLGFLSAILLWGWLELAFLTGVITGPVVRPCPPGIPEWERFFRAWGVIAYAEIALVAVLLILWVLSDESTNPTAFWTFGTLFAARLAAKLNLWLGVPRVNAELLPRRIAHAASHFRQAPPTAFFALSVMGLAGAACGWTWLASTTSGGVHVGASLVAALTLLALFEHALMVVPLPDAALWRWTEAKGPRKAPRRT